MIIIHSPSLWVSILGLKSLEMLTLHEEFMQRALDLASLGEGDTSPNPQVGAVLVHDGVIIGEGYHKQHGKAHAEVNAIQAVREEHVHLIPKSTLYVSLEPCCIYGRTPPCTELILRHRIPRVITSATDLSSGIQGRGVSLLRKGGVEVTTGILAEQGELLAAQRNTYVKENRPYILLKFAMSKDGFIGRASHQVHLSNPVSWRFVHRLRHRVDAIMVGTETVLTDDPLLTNRLFWGNAPIRVIPDLHDRIPVDCKLFQTPSPTWVFRSKHRPVPLIHNPNVRFFLLDPEEPILLQIVQSLANEQITGLLVEGGSKLLRSFIADNLWDEAIVSSCSDFMGDGIPNPGNLMAPSDHIHLLDNELYWFRNSNQDVVK
jgi:diaminohydroxyphosphoribosylaminopyrimidine deaminase/5-amino-6-(5-phosphoribosylamino)uracil reductase